MESGGSEIFGKAYEVKACEFAGTMNKLGTKGKGEHKMVGNWDTKGCYAYKTGPWAGVVWFGTGASEYGGNRVSLVDWEIAQGKYRPNGYDCSKCKKAGTV